MKILNNIEKLILEIQNTFKRVSVIIIRNNKICITKNHEFPGGKVEINESNEQAAFRECLEEVGIQIKNIKYSGFKSDFNSNITTWKIPGTCYWYYAEFDKINKKLFNKDNDSTSFKWIDLQEALELSKNSRFGINNYNALKKLIVENHKYTISGAIEGCLNIPYKQLNMGLYRAEVYKDDPWIALLSTKYPLSKEQLKEFDKHYILDPDKKNIPYYYVINNTYIKFTSSNRWFTKKEALIYGKKMGLKSEHLDFK